MKRIVLAIFILLFTATSCAENHSFDDDLLETGDRFFADYLLEEDCGNDSTSPGNYYDPATRTCTGDNPAIKGFKYLNRPNHEARAGDIIYIRGDEEGAYPISSSFTSHNLWRYPSFPQGIKPSHSGEPGKPITYRNYQGERVSIEGIQNRGGRGIWIKDQSHIKVTGLIFQNLSGYLWIEGGSYNEISHCLFRNMRDAWNNLLEWGDDLAVGIHTGEDGSSHLAHEDDGTPDGRFNRLYLWNLSTGGACEIEESTSTGKRCRHPLFGGDRNGDHDRTWRRGDQYSISGQITWAGSYINFNSHNNWIHNNRFHNYGAYSWKDEGVVLEIGPGTGTRPDGSDYNTIEFNELYAGGHHVFGANTCKHCVIRNNYFHNESWHAGPEGWPCSTYAGGVCGYRVISCTSGNPDVSGHSLWEHNKIGYGAQFGGPNARIYYGSPGGSGSGTTLATPGNIYRLNEHFHNALFGMRFGASVAGAGDKNKVYNNTFFRNGYNYHLGFEPLDIYRGGIHFYGIRSGMSIKNNLLYDHWSETNRFTGSLYYPAIYVGEGAIAEQNITNNTIRNNFCDDWSYSRSTFPFGVNSPDPLFVDDDVSDPSALTLSEGRWVGSPDLSLRKGSPAIDGGIHLTVIHSNDTGAGTSLIVEDARYFQDGTWGSELARGKNFFADWIAVGAVNNTVEIVSVDYDTNTITVIHPVQRSEGDPVWLYKDSHGDVVLTGPAPNYGAYQGAGEY